MIPPGCVCSESGPLASHVGTRRSLMFQMKECCSASVRSWQDPPRCLAHILPGSCADAQGCGCITDLRTSEIRGENILSSTAPSQGCHDHTKVAGSSPATAVLGFVCLNVLPLFFFFCVLSLGSALKEKPRPTSEHFTAEKMKKAYYLTQKVPDQV